MSESYAYTLTLPTSLAHEWGFFESRGYLPAMPGDLLDEGATVWTLGVSEPEAWEFRDAWDDLGEAAGTCVADVGAVLDFLDDIV